MFLPFLDGNWCCLSLMWNQLCLRVFLSPMWFNQGLNLFLNRARLEQGLDIFFLIGWMILLLIWIGLKILRRVIMSGQFPPSKLSNLNPLSVQNPVSGTQTFSSRADLSPVRRPRTRCSGSSFTPSQPIETTPPPPSKPAIKPSTKSSKKSSPKTHKTPKHTGPSEQKTHQVEEIVFSPEDAADKAKGKAPAKQVSK